MSFTMDRRFMFCVLLLVMSWVHGQSQIPTSDLSVIGLFGAIGISAGIATTMISITASNLQTDLDNCLKKTAEMDQNVAVNCAADAECQGQITKCVQDVEDLVSSIPDLEERVQKLELLDKVCEIHPRLCRCGKITDKDECTADSDCRYRDGPKLCVPDVTTG